MFFLKTYNNRFKPEVRGRLSNLNSPINSQGLITPSKVIKSDPSTLERMKPMIAGFNRKCVGGCQI